MTAVVLRFRRRVDLGPPERAALARVLGDPTFELIPLRSALDRVAVLPAGAAVSVTASPGKGLDATLDLAEALQARGFQAVPHVASRMVRNRDHLRELLRRMHGNGIERAFVVGGDATEPGSFPDGLSLLREMADVGHSLKEIGIPCYPQGHAFIDDHALLEALRAKEPFASYMTTQLCFDATAIAGWVRARRAEGFALPVKLGIPGVVEPQRLMMIGARIGVRDTQRFVAKNMRLVARLLRSGGFYRPDGLVEDLARLAAEPAAGIAALHLYTFNAVEPTEAWRVEFLDRLGASDGDAAAREALIRDLAGIPRRLSAESSRDRRTQGEGWSPRDVVRHLIRVEREVWQARLRELERGGSPHWRWTEPGLATVADEEEPLETFAAERRETIALLRGLDHAAWHRSGHHERLGRLDVAGLVREALRHDEEHLASLDGRADREDAIGA